MMFPLQGRWEQLVGLGATWLQKLAESILGFRPSGDASHPSAALGGAFLTSAYFTDFFSQ
jgi:hypothetical protein